MYSYDQIRKIKEDLLFIISEVKKSKYTILNVSNLKEFEVAVSEYDVVLNQIGKNGFCTDAGLIQGFTVTEEWILKIKNSYR